MTHISTTTPIAIHRIRIPHLRFPDLGLAAALATLFETIGDTYGCLCGTLPNSQWRQR